MEKRPKDICVLSVCERPEQVVCRRLAGRELELLICCVRRMDVVDGRDLSTYSPFGNDLADLNTELGVGWSSPSTLTTLALAPSSAA